LLKSKDTVVSRNKFIYKYIASRDGMSIYASRRVASIRDWINKNGWIDQDL